MKDERLDENLCRTLWETENNIDNVVGAGHANIGSFRMEQI